MPRFGGGQIWTAQEIAITAIVGVAVAIYAVVRFIKMPIVFAGNLFDTKSEQIKTSGEISKEI